MALRILLVSNAPWTGTGYGTQAAQLGRKLRDAGHHVAFFANYGLSGSQTVWEGFPVYPSALSPVGDDLIHGHADDWDADVVLVLYDGFAMNGMVHRQLRQLVMVWQPVDCAPFGRGDMQYYTASGAQPVAMSRFGAAEMEHAGLDPLYAPHGIDTVKTFVPAEEIVWRSTEGSRAMIKPDGSRNSSRADARRTLREQNGLPEDAFLVGMNVHNKDADRKAVFEQMSAFALFSRKHSDALLMCHTMPHPVMSGNDLIGMADFLGIGDKVRWADPYSLLAGNYTPADMAKWYAQLDLYTGASRGEGFGIPLIEAQACGVPVVTTDASAMSELGKNGWLVSGQPYWQKGHHALWTTPDIGELADCYERAYGRPPAMQEKMSSRARKFAQRYDADAVFKDFWEPIWTETERRLKGELPGTGPEDSHEGWSLVK